MSAFPLLVARSQFMSTRSVGMWGACRRRASRWAPHVHHR